MIKKKFVFLCLFFLIVGTGLSVNFIDHELSVKLDPGKHFINVTDEINIPNARPGEKIHFLLHGNLNIFYSSPNVKLELEAGEIRSKFFGINTSEFKISDKIPISHFSIIFLNKNTKVILKYKGLIYHPLKMSGAEYSRGFSETPGIISDKGVYLSGSSFWIPWINDGLVTFRMKVDTPSGWSSVSQGKRISSSEWDSREPMDEAYLIAGKFHLYKTIANGVNIFAYLRTEDKNLAEKYLDTTSQYMKMYEKMIGKYPYSKFALIENFWETGYGMPSFTLLGPKIIRFPFILHSSYPHELLHNWWGNSVFVNYKKGNWCEGLTVFLADHLIKEQRGKGAEYRRNTLKGYKDYVNNENEFPVSEFKARFNSSSSAIGYGKVMMIFNMLRVDLGDKVFLRSIRDFYSNNKFKKATFEDIRKSFEKISKKNLSTFFNQWIYRKGAPLLKISDVRSKRTKHGYELKFRISQYNVKDPYLLKIPVYFYIKGKKEVIVKRIITGRKTSTFSFKFSAEPLKIEVDPSFDVFRVLSDDEIPATFSNIFGSKKVLIVRPTSITGGEDLHYGELASIWSKEKKDVIKTVSDADIKKIPSDRSVWILGWNNRFRSSIEKLLKQHDGKIVGNELFFGKKKIDHKKNSIILSFKNPLNPDCTIAFLSTDRKEAISGLARKLPHYGKYSYLGFSGDEPAVNLKGQWDTANSPLVRVLKKGDYSGYKKPERKALGYLEPLFSTEKMKKHIEFLASKDLKGRGLGTPELDKAAEYIKNRFIEYGLNPGGDNESYFENWSDKVSKFPKKIKLKNIIGIIPGTKKEFDGQAVVVSAHYDHLGLGWPDVRKGNEGKIHPGADDNASGIAVLLELARTLGKNFKPDRTLIFAAFTGEENGLMGSGYFVKNYKKFDLKNIIGDINLDTVGRLNGKKPMIIGGSSAREWKFIFMGIGFTTGVESDIIQQDLDASDQVSFINSGIPAIQIFSGPQPDYHKPSDTIDKIDYLGMVKITSIAKEALIYLSERKLPLTFTGKASKMTKKRAANTDKNQNRDEARPSIGIMPDFRFNGKGVKVGMVLSKNGINKNLEKGDIIIGFNGVGVTDLKSYTKELYKYKPDNVVNLRVVRNGKSINIKIKLIER